MTQQLGGEPARPDGFEEFGGTGQVGLGHAGGRFLRWAQYAEQAVHLLERLAAGPLGEEQRLLLGLLLGPQQPSHPADVQHRDTQAVRHDIVQLARDPAPLLGYRGRRLPRGLPLELGGPLLEQLRASLPDAHRVAGQPDAADEQAGEKEVARRRAVLDQDRSPAQGQCRNESQDGARTRDTPRTKPPPPRPAAA